MSLSRWFFDPLIKELRKLMDRFFEKLGVIMADNLQPVLDRMDQGIAAVQAAANGIRELDITLEELRAVIAEQQTNGGLTAEGAAKVNPKVDALEAALGDLGQAVIDAQNDDPNLPNIPNP